MPLFDITMPIQDQMVSWPGDPAVSVERRLDIAKGDPASVSLLQFGSHTGTHVDAFSHFNAHGKSLDQMDLNRYIGKALVVEINDPLQVTVTELQTVQWHGVERVIFKTQNSNQYWGNQPFNPQFVHIAPDAAEFLVNQGVQLVGVDYLSVEGYAAHDAPTHHHLMDHGVYIVEGLYLKDIDPGWYEMICLPLALLGGDGAPARVVLKTLDPDPRYPV